MDDVSSGESKFSEEEIFTYLGLALTEDDKVIEDKEKKV